MNLIVLFESDFITDNVVRLTDRRFEHIKQIQQVVIGDSLKVGLLNGKLGTSTVTDIDQQQLTMEVALDNAPPAALPVTLIMALPRPKMLKRTFETIAAMGVKKLYLINSFRVDKSFWSSPLLQPDNIEKHLLLGLEQAGDTVMPEVIINKRFKPFVEDELPALTENTRALVAHPYEAEPCPIANDIETTLVIGPEGGFIPYEVAKLNQAGCNSIHIGTRILRVETAVPVLLARLFPL